MKIVIANDHAAVSLKMEIMQYLQELGHEVVNIGTDVAERCNYPDFGERAARMVCCRGSGLRRSDLRHRRGDLHCGE